MPSHNEQGHAHEHGHSHGHSHNHGHHSLQSEEFAANYDTQPWQLKMAEQTTAYLRNNLDFLGLPQVKAKGDEAAEPIRLLDYACGTGMVTKALAPYITEAVGLDFNPHMIARYSSLDTEVPTKGVVGDLLAPSFTEDPALSDPSMFNFTLAAVGYGFHHFSSHSLALAALAQRLRPGGKILIIDFQDDDVQLNGPEVSAHGFSKDSMKSLFDEVGLVDFEYRLMSGEVAIGDQGLKKKAFLSVASVPA